tara:strand:+ start:439 stop:645 length:207 start_codon:yes stop_codon:yes gene_type:complete
LQRADVDGLKKLLVLVTMYLTPYFINDGGEWYTYDITALFSGMVNIFRYGFALYFQVWFCLPAPDLFA